LKPAQTPPASRSHSDPSRKRAKGAQQSRASPEALPLLLTLSSGVKGFTTIHAAHARGALSRIRFLAELSESARNLPHSALTTLVADAVDLVVFSHRGTEGPRVTEILAVEDLAGSPDTGAFTVTDVFTRTGPDRDLCWTGDVPHRLAAAFTATGQDLLAVLDGRAASDAGAGPGRRTDRNGARA
jgi:pilus assembly protein CpaF